MQPGQAGSFRFQHTIETQPVPMGSGRSIPSLFLLLMGSLLTVAGYWLLLRSPGLLDQPFKTAVWLPALATAVTAIRSGRRMRQTAWELAHTFRFSSELIEFPAMARGIWVRSRWSTACWEAPAAISQQLLHECICRYRPLS